MLNHIDKSPGAIGKNIVEGKDWNSSLRFQIPARLGGELQ